MSTVPADYEKRVNRAIDYILQDLTRPLRLADVSRAAGVSPCHFHRVFKATMGETLAGFAKRQRLQQALYMMSHANGRSLTEVALRCGFASSSDFSRSFRRHYGAAPSSFDLAGFRNAGSDELEQIMHRNLRPLTVLAVGANPDAFTVSIRDVPARTVAYIRVFDPYRDGAVRAACERLLHWATERGLADGEWLGYMWDEPEIAGAAKCCYDVALVVNRVDPIGEISRFDFPPMRVATVAVRGDLALEARAIDWLYKTWLPQSGYVPDDHPMFEAWIGRPYAHGDAYFDILCQLPLTRA